MWGLKMKFVVGIDTRRHKSAVLAAFFSPFITLSGCDVAAESTDGCKFQNLVQLCAKISI
jgi:hypothetical protein